MILVGSGDRFRDDLLEKVRCEQKPEDKQEFLRCQRRKEKWI